MNWKKKKNVMNRLELQREEEKSFFFQRSNKMEWRQKRNWRNWRNDRHTSYFPLYKIAYEIICSNETKKGFFLMFPNSPSGYSFYDFRTFFFHLLLLPILFYIHSIPSAAFVPIHFPKWIHYGKETRSREPEFHL